MDCFGKRFGSPCCIIITNEQTSIPPLPLPALLLLCFFLFFNVKYTFETQFSRLNALLSGHVHYLKDSALKKKKRDPFLPTDSSSRAGPYCHTRCISFSATQLGKRLSQFVCISKMCQFYVFCLDELLKLYFAGVRKSVKE